MNRTKEQNLEDFVRRLADAQVHLSDDVGYFLFSNWKEEAQGIIGLMDAQAIGVKK